ncbi:MAG: TlpA disulfide reductase family protein [Chitinophagales bacterium]
MRLAKSNSPKVILLLFLLFSGILNLTAGDEVKILNYEQFEKRIKSDKEGTVVYNFWATWCKPCVEEIPYFEKINAEYKEKGVRVVFVSLDFKSQYEKKLLPFVEKNEMKSEVLLLDAPDYNNWLDKISTKWSGAIPATLIVNNNTGRWDFYEQSFTYNELKSTINK